MHYWQDYESREMPEWFTPLEPDQQQQCELFREPMDALLSRLKVSKDELDAWHKAGWVTADLTEKNELEDLEVREVTFVADIVRSGLPAAAINKLILALPVPRSCSPDVDVYSFRYGWVRVDPSRHVSSDHFFEMTHHGYEWTQRFHESPDQERVIRLWLAFLDEAMKYESRIVIREWESRQEP